MQSYAVVGTGAVGGFIGWKLANAGHDVHFVARSNYPALLNSGLTICQPDMEQRLWPISVFPSVDRLPLVDVIIVATKTTDIEHVSAQLARHQPSTTVVAFHNGLCPESIYVEASTERVLLGGVAYLTAELSAPTCVRIEGEHRLVIGPIAVADEQALSIATEVVEQLSAAGLQTDLSSHLRTDRWHKIAWSLIFAGPCTILDVDTNQLVRSPTLRALQEQIFCETKAVARADGVMLPSSEIAVMIADAASSPGHVVSMTIDRRRGRPLEDDAIYGAVCRRAVELGIRTPVLDTVHSLLTFTLERSK